jgi:hypothetical protein
MTTVAHRENLIIHDADAHFIEYDGWLEKYAKDFVKENLLPGLIPLDMSFLVPLMDAAKKRVAGGNPELTAELKANLFGHKAKLKQWPVFGAFNSAEQSEASHSTYWGLARSLSSPQLELPDLLATTIPM